TCSVVLSQNEHIYPEQRHVIISLQCFVLIVQQGRRNEDNNYSYKTRQRGVSPKVPQSPHEVPPLVHLLDGGPLGAGSCLLSTAGRRPPSLVQLADDRVTHLLKLLLLVLVLLLLGQLVVLQPSDGLFALLRHLLQVLRAHLAPQVLVPQAAAHAEGVGLQGVLGGDPVSLKVVLGLVFVGVLHHPLDLLLAQPALVV
uniref:Uncharacterized protein n=1 Tax=Gasterosteus aculeatus TaxID=69293 RepID=G3PI30_GASAC